MNEYFVKIGDQSVIVSADYTEIKHNKLYFYAWPELSDAAPIGHDDLVAVFNVFDFFFMQPVGLSIAERVLSK